MAHSNYWCRTRLSPAVRMLPEPERVFSSCHRSFRALRMRKRHHETICCRKWQYSWFPLTDLSRAFHSESPQMAQNGHEKRSLTLFHAHLCHSCFGNFYLVAIPPVLFLPFFGLG